MTILTACAGSIAWRRNLGFVGSEFGIWMPSQAARMQQVSDRRLPCGTHSQHSPYQQAWLDRNNRSLWIGRTSISLMQRRLSFNQGAMFIRQLMLG